MPINRVNNFISTATCTTPGITYLDGLRIHRAMIAGIQTVIAGQDHLNKINVFPVPDGDTGTNLALTLSAVMSSLRASKDRQADKMLMTIADAALDGARGNSGAILAQFFQGVSDAVVGVSKISAQQFARAIKSGEAYAREAMSSPREGTVLTVMRDFADQLIALTEKESSSDFVSLFNQGLNRARRSLANTPKQLEALRKAGVVDAGAEGFVRLIDGIHNYISHGDVNSQVPELNAIEIEDSTRQMAGEMTDLDYRYCTECIVTGDDIDRRKLREALSTLGGSLVFAGTKQKVKIHIHVNDANKVFDVAGRFGQVRGQKADDMLQQQEISHQAKQKVVVTIDSAADLSDEDMERLNIHMIPVKLHFGAQSYLDKVAITADEFFDMLESRSEHPKTSQPSPGEFRRNFDYLSSHYDNVLSVNVTGWGSGTVQAAENAAARSKHQSVHVYDSKLASVGQALIAIHAAECAQKNMSIEQITQQLTEIQPRTNLCGVFPDLSLAVRGGRVKPIVKKIADWFNLAPIFSFSDKGQLKTHRLLFGRHSLAQRLANIAAKKIVPGGNYRIGVAYGTDKSGAEQLLHSIEQYMTQKQCTIEHKFTTRLGSALGAHAGPGCLVIAYQRLK